MATDPQKLKRQRKVKNLLWFSYIGCARCGYKEFYAGLVFHHVEERTTKRQVASLSLGRQREELDKCIILCHTCHFTLHAKQWVGTFVKDTFGYKL